MFVFDCGRMARRNTKIFHFNKKDVKEYSMADNSDHEDALILVEEDRAFILQDMEAGVSKVIIELTGAPDSTPGPDLTHGPSSYLDSPLSSAVPE
ncbi:unnamed protein product [Parnassius mnemosyne]|uniref:Uncharacterized protein n=1 Tax=Parnassius mnemosyne TaxID=213953 RepID=A0AAV1L3F5_9NEOP